MSVSSSAESNSSPPQRRRRRKLIFASFVLLFLLAILVILVAPRPSNDKITWLTHAGMAQAKSGGLLARVASRLRWVISPFRRFVYRGPKALLEFDSSIWSLSSTATAQIDLGKVTAAGTDGARAWILSPTALDLFRKRLKELPGATLASNPRTDIADGVESKMFIGNSPAGLSVDVVPRFASGAFRLLIEVTKTEINPGPPAASPALTTNFAIACRAAIPNGGALVIDAGNSGTNNYWLVLAPKLIDATGKPIKSPASAP